MWTKTKISPSDEYPTAKSLTLGLLEKLCTKANDSSWAHFETTTSGRLFKKALFVEVAYENKNTLILNLGTRSEAENIPANWMKKKDVWEGPRSDTEKLSEWIENHFKQATVNEEFQAKAWIDGT